MKQAIKRVLAYMLYYAKRKGYRQKSYVDGEITPVVADKDRFTFYGYYDRSPEVGNYILLHSLRGDELDIVLVDKNTQKEMVIGTTRAFNFQMGARAIWKDADTISWNDFDGEKYVCYIYSIPEKKVVKTLPIAVMDYCEPNRAIGVNFRRLLSVDPDYAYRNLPEMDEASFTDYSNDGIWMYDLDTDTSSLLLSIKDILACKGKLLYEAGRHAVNHITRSPDGTKFMFIHRYKHEGRRYDRLMVYDFNTKTLKCLLDDPVQSHFCWLGNDEIMGYCSYEGKLGFYEVNVETSKVKKLEQLTALHPKNGHPTPFGDWVVIDAYPDLSRMQRLIAYNMKTGEHRVLTEVFHDLAHRNYTRCDLHPRFNIDGTRIYFDTISTGTRQLCFIPVSLPIS